MHNNKEQSLLECQNKGTPTSEVQSCAIAHYKGPMLVLAGPGAGKTFVLTNRIHNLIYTHHISPNRILVITFTKKAALEMKERAIQIDENARAVMFGTFHSVFLQILLRTEQYNHVKPCTEYEKKELLTKILYANHIDSDQITAIYSKLLREISYVKNLGIPVAEYEPKAVEKGRFLSIYKNYNEELHKSGKVDFDDMLLLCYDYLKKHPSEREKWQNLFQFILIDEFQDINLLLWKYSQTAIA